MANTDFHTFGWMYDSGRFWTVTRKKANNVQDKREDLMTIRAVSKAYINEMKAQGVDVAAEIPFVELPVEVDYLETESVNKEGARSL